MVRLAVVAPVFHRYVAPPEAVIVAGAWAQEIALVAAAMGIGLAVTTVLAVALQPVAGVVTVTVYVPDVLTVIAALAAPVLQR